MKIFISDIHLLTEEPVSYGYRPISEADVKALWDDIKDKKVWAGAEWKKVKDTQCPIELIILGDFIDVIRDPEWLWSSRQKVLQESLRQNFRNEDWKKVVKEIVDYHTRGPIFARLKELFGNPDLGRKIIYVVGNHDRLINFIPEACYSIRKALGQENPDPTRFDSEYICPELGIYAEHGHKVDSYNYETGCDEDPSKIPIGDLIVWLLINAFPARVSRRGLPITVPDKGDFIIPDGLGQFMAELDNLRPTTLAPEWIEYSYPRFQLDHTFNEIKQAWEEQFKELSKNLPFWKLHKILPLRFAASGKLAKSFKKMYEKLAELLGWGDPNLCQALRYAREKEKYRYFIFGHTHEACVKLLEERNDERKYYLNTGTWRRRIIMSSAPCGKIAFAPIKTFNYLLFYESAERPPNSSEMDKRFELCDLSTGIGEYQ